MAKLLTSGYDGSVDAVNFNSAFYYYLSSCKERVLKLSIHVDFLIYIFLANLLFVFANVPLIHRIIKAPPGYIFTLSNIDIYTDDLVDYNQYLSAITQGSGSFLYRDPYTNEQTKSGFFFSFYILLGKITSISGIWPPYAYHISRIASVELFLLSVYKLANSILKRPAAFWTAVMAVFTTISPSGIFAESEAFKSYFPWWNSLNAVSRIDAPPHHIFGQFLLLCSIYFLLNFLKYKDKKSGVSAVVFAFVSGMIITTNSLLLLTVLPVSFLLFQFREYLIKRRVIVSKKLILILISLSGASLLTVFFVFLQIKAGFPWDMWSKWEMAMWNDKPLVNRSFFFIFGILPFMALPGIIKVWKEGRFENILIFIWAIFPFLLLPFASILGVGKVRLVMAAPFVPFAILTGMAMENKLKLIYPFVFLVFTIPLIVNSGMARINYVRAESVTGTDRIYLNEKSWAGINFIKESLPSRSIILSGPKIGNVIPAFSLQKTYVGHVVLSKEYPVKENNMWKFFSGQFDDSQTQTFVMDNDISYVFFGTEEKSFGKPELDYSFLFPIFKNSEVVIYKVNPR